MHKILLLIVLLLAASCRQTASPTPEASLQAADITVTVNPNPPSVGDATLLITVSKDDAPLVDAPVTVRGDMNHAGMRPVIADGTTTDDGSVSLPFSWTMGGDWIVTVTVTLPDGSEVSQTFDFSVSS